MPPQPGYPSPNQSGDHHYPKGLRPLALSLIGALAATGGAYIYQHESGGAHHATANHASGAPSPTIDPSTPVIIKRPTPNQTTTPVETVVPAEYEEAPLKGSIDMSALSSRLTEKEKETAKKNHANENGYPVVKLFEFTAKLSNGEKKLSPTKLSEAVNAQDAAVFESVVERDATLLNYLVNAGKITSVNFSVASDPKQIEGRGDGDMRFTAETRNADGTITPGHIDYVLPPSGEVTAQAASEMIHHEGTHLTQRNLQAVDKVNDGLGTEVVGPEVQTNDKAYAELCGQMRASSIAVAERDPKVLEAAQKVVALTKNSKSFAGKQFIAANALIHGTFNTLQGTTAQPKDGFLGVDFKIPECRMDDPYSVASNLQGDRPGELTNEQNAAAIELEIAFQYATYKTSSTLGIFKESNYLHTSITDGHPTDNTAELFASAMNVMMTYPEEIAKNIKALKPADRATALSFLKLLTADTIRANAKNPASIMLIDQTRQTLAWVEKHAA